MSSEFLDGLDAAVGQRCACLCGRSITDASPSAYYASQACATVWHLRRMSPAAVEACADAFGQLWQALREAFVSAVNAFVEALRRLREQLCALSAGTASPPAVLRQPPPWHRAPMSIGPAAGFTTAPLGQRMRWPVLR